MDYKFGSGLELLLAHMHVEDIINAAETLYQLEEEEEEAGLSFDEEGLSQEEMDENEEIGDRLVSGKEQKDYGNRDGGVRYGTVQDLLSFKDMAVKKRRYQINMDVLLFPWKLTYKNPGSGLVPKGSFGKVHLAQDITTRKRMACKLARFRHENIAELYGAVLWDQSVHLFMEAGEGGSVLEKLDSCGPMREFEIIWVAKQVLRGLEYLHSHHVIHHDVKRKRERTQKRFFSSNIVLMSDKAVLVDFGLTVQMTEEMYTPRDLRGTEVRKKKQDKGLRQPYRMQA
ncbi:hypothetical protein XENOCAPTIV_029212 [Xenoophorus captivus]|uniref:Protein kinase domain-containing protein n=1 Tax=Xenoophorus captivus TaxID=1517983 RepID=A0ABV0REE6_9TELE